MFFWVCWWRRAVSSRILLTVAKSLTSRKFMADLNKVSSGLLRDKSATYFMAFPLT